MTIEELMNFMFFNENFFRSYTFLCLEFEKKNSKFFKKMCFAQNSNFFIFFYQNRSGTLELHK